MSAWPGKFIIGLTGNIATGKSVVRKMLEHLGAYGIDADALAHRAIAKGAPGYQPVVVEFGRWVLANDDQIDRTKLARIVFSDPEALRRLEAIVHPLVGEAVEVLIRRSRQKVIVIEAIKLLEGSLRSICDSIWVTYAAEQVQLARLTQKRGLTLATARQRVKAQPSQASKIAAADVAIRNESSFEDRVLRAWQEQFPAAEELPVRQVLSTKGELNIERAGPQQAGEIAGFLSQHNNKGVNYRREDVMATFGEKAFLLLRRNNKLVGLVGWQVENLVARTDDIYLESGLSVEQSMLIMMDEIESASRDLQCEALLLFLPLEMAGEEAIWQRMKYQRRTIESLGVRAWQEAARESMPADTVMLFKQLRKDRVLRPV